MKLPKTIRGYISIFKKIDNWSPSSLIGFDKLSIELQNMIYSFDAAISNHFSEIIEKWNEEKSNP